MEKRRLSSRRQLSGRIRFVFSNSFDDEHLSYLNYPSKSDNMAWIRGNISVIYVGDEGGVGQLSIVDHQHELVENAADGLVDLTPRESDDEVAELFNQELISTQASVDEVKFSAAKTWLGSDKTSRVEDRYNCKIYNVDGLQYRVLHRCLKETLLPAKSADGKKPTIAHSTGDELKFPWDRYISADNKGKPIVRFCPISQVPSQC
jgi:hypothetical protein